MRRKINLTLLILVLLIGVPYYWLLLDNRPGNAQAKPISIAQLRELSGSVPGQAPKAIELELTAHRLVPRTLFAAGNGLKRAVIGVMAWRLPVEGGKPIVIDTGLNAIDAKAMGMAEFWPERQAKVERAMDEAGLILATHEHPDHLGALARKGGAALASVARLNAGQVPPSSYAASLAWSEKPPQPSLAAEGLQAVAPGVVVIPAPSHTPGSQMIYVRLADGREVLFAGDIATMAASWQELRARSRLVGDYLAPENRSEVFAWLRTIRALKKEAPGLLVIPGHDFEWLIQDKAAKAVVRIGFRQ
ncbi:MBL fold metallo-hydrolase [Novosphingobium ginsenosidimutans]|uniref:MBL fold metallo-hydrolase n=1 Tax=Novosphingobium ginsenosidimutans TaxID=1176536 RepID=A0A5B8S5K4_9SPHN|nr:MBL fold metallo-hydrolase [Novosphingobium ginsenosidimutans]QEA16673.1 MBL fold metallo-hydrolase [Novosphingobium ginsenosidimutans]